MRGIANIVLTICILQKPNESQCSYEPACCRLMHQSPYPWLKTWAGRSARIVANLVNNTFSGRHALQYLFNTMLGLTSPCATVCMTLALDFRPFLSTLPLLKPFSSQTKTVMVRAFLAFWTFYCFLDRAATVSLSRVASRLSSSLIGILVVFTLLGFFTGPFTSYESHTTCAAAHRMQ